MSPPSWPSPVAEFIEDGDEPYYGEIPGLQGVWAAEATLEEARKVLQEVLEEWILLGLRQGAEIPPIGDISLNPQAVA